MKWAVLACLLAMAPVSGAWAGDFALCQQSVDAELKFAGCNGLLARDPKFAEAYSGRGLALVAMGETERAIADYSYAIGVDPGLLVAYYNRGLSYLEVDEPGLAAEDFGTVIARNPGDATAYNGRALAYATLARNDDAEADFTRAITLDPTYVRALVGRGNLLLARKLFTAALKDFNRALAINPDSQDAILGRGYATTGALPAELEVVGSTTPLSLEPTTAPMTRLSRLAARRTKRGAKSVAGWLEPRDSAMARPGRASAAATDQAGIRSIDPTLSERSCNNYQGEPCAVSSR